jgi:hypothetical protein
MKTICLLCWMGFLGACSTQQAARVNCDGKLRAINAPPPLALNSPDRVDDLRSPYGAP